MVWISIYFSEIFVGIRAIEDPTTNFRGTGPPHLRVIGAYGT